MTEDEIHFVWDNRKAASNRRKHRVSFETAAFVFDDPHRLEERRRLEAVTDAEAEAGARSDPDNPPLSEAQLNRMVVAREVRRVRESAGLSQAQFAERYRLGLSRLRDWEQGRFAPDFIAMAFLQLVVDRPDIADELVEKVDRGHLAA